MAQAASWTHFTVRSGDLMNTSICKLAKQLRSHLRQKRWCGVKHSNRLFKLEYFLYRRATGNRFHRLDRAGHVNGTVSYMPSIFGLTLQRLVI